MKANCCYKIFNWLIVLSVGHSLLAQQPGYQLNRIQEEGGLKTFDILNIARDKKGFLWIASQGSVHRFDGKHTQIFPFEESVNAIMVDSKDRKWARTRAGISRYEEDSSGFRRILVGNDTTSVAALYEAPGGSVGALVDGRLFTYDENQQSFLPNKTPSSNSQERYSRYFAADAHALLFSNRDTIYRYNINAGRTASVVIRNISSVFPLSPEMLLVATNDFKTYTVNIISGEKYLLGSGSAGNEQFGEDLNVYNGVHLSAQEFLFCSNKGLFQYDVETNTLSYPVFYRDGRPLQNQQSITSLYKDKEGVIYMNHADGIFFFKCTGSFMQYFRNNSLEPNLLFSNDVRNFAEDQDGNIWMATTNGLTRLKVQTGGLEHFGPLNKASIIDFPSYRQLLSDGANLWIGTSGIGVWLYDIKKDQCSRPAFPSSEQGKKEEELFNKTYVWEILKLANGKLLVIGGSHLFIIDPQKLTAKQVPVGRFRGISRSGIQDAAGRIWHGTTAGLLCYDSTFNLLFSLRDSFPDKRIASFCEWQKNRMLVGSKGLFEIELDGNRVVSFKRKKGIPQNLLVYCMKQDRQGFVWIGTDEGIFRYDPLKDESNRFDQSDHVQSHAFNSDAAFLSSSGLMYMGGRNGVNYFDPRNFSVEPEILHPLVLSIKSNPDDTSYFGSGHIIPYSSRNIDFVINAPAFKKPFRIQYRYRLKDGSDWINTGFNNHVHIGRLQPGSYSLMVSASYDGSNWFDSEESITFSVSKPWWKTWWFRIFCVLVLAGALIAFDRYRRKRREAKELKRMVDYFSNSGSTADSVDLILWDITTNCISRLGFDDCVIYLYEPERNMLVQKAAYGAKSTKAFEINDPIEIPLGKGITGHVAQTLSSLIVNDTSKDSRYIVDDERRYSEIAVPVVHDGRLIGVIDSENRKKNFFTAHHLRTLETISSLCASKIAVALALEETKKAENEVSALNAKMMESKFVNLRLQMNPHFLFNILTTIQYLIVSNQVNRATEYLNIFSSFLRSLLNYAEETVVSLDDELRVLSMYVELESLCLDETFEWEIDVDEEIDKEEVLVPFMLLQPFVENAINHGLIHKVGQKKFSISIREYDPDALICTIEDSGIGREASQAINQKNLSRVVHPSKGLGIVKKRLDLLQEKTGKRASLEIEDMYKNEVATGTRVKIIIPYYSNEEI